MKMNKQLLPIILFPLALSITSCGGNEGGKGSTSESVPEQTIDSQKSDEGRSEESSSEEIIVNQKDVDNLKALLARQDLSPFNEKAFMAEFRQNFSVYTNLIGDDGKYIEFINYNGLGNVGYYYDVDVETYKQLIEDKNTNTFDIMCQGYGYYGLVQYATTNSFLNDEFEEKEDRERSTYIQQVQAQFDETNLQIQNYYIFSDYFDDDNNDYRIFNGTIGKDILFGAYTTEVLSNVFSRINIYDGPGYCETIDSFYYQICFSLLESSDKEISEFIINNNLQYAESDKYSELSFELQEEKYIEQLDESDIIPGAVKGTLYLNKETKELDSFEYTIVHIEESFDQSSNYVHTASMEFKANGYSHHGKHEGEPSMEEDPTVFTDPNEFMDQVIMQVISKNA